MKLNLSEEGKKIALEIANESKEKNIYENVISVEDAFLLLINNVQYKDLDNLCKYMQKEFRSKNIDFNIDECYELTQGKAIDYKSKSLVKNDILEEYKNIIWDSANKCIKEKSYLGNNTINEGRINTSSWISHSIYESIAMKKLAKMINCDEHIAEVLGLLHDIGRKKTHDFTHTVKGFEELIEKGYKYEAIPALTHSFINGGRCANCDLPEEGFYINKEGKPSWKDEDSKDDITKYFLDIYKYSEYDHLLNIADLMATDKKIVSCVERVKDIRTRKPAGSNEKYFIVENIKLQKKILDIIGINYEISVDMFNSIEKINDEFEKISKVLFEIFNKE